MKITFEPAYKDADLMYDPPLPAIKDLPEWYKGMPLTINGDKPELTGNGGSNYTIKGCSPFLDSLGAGYLLTLPCDVFVKLNEEGDLNFTWLADIPELITSHDSRQVDFLPQKNHNGGGALKWKAGWKIHTPKGYSTLFLHPLNRQELPFYTISGMVETDRYNVATEFPFLMNHKVVEEPFLLEKGTPIVQAIPFKRDDWDSSIVPFDEKSNSIALNKLRSKAFRSYKKQFWQKKQYN